MGWPLVVGVAEVRPQRRLQVDNKWTMVCLAVLLFVASAFAPDLGSGVLSGDITDPSGAAISAAELPVASKARGIASG